MEFRGVGGREGRRRLSFREFRRSVLRRLGFRGIVVFGIFLRLDCGCGFIFLMVCLFFDFVLNVVSVNFILDIWLFIISCLCLFFLV